MAFAPPLFPFSLVLLPITTYRISFAICDDSDTPSLERGQIHRKIAALLRAGGYSRFDQYSNGYSNWITESDTPASIVWADMMRLQELFPVHGIRMIRHDQFTTLEYPIGQPSSQPSSSTS